ncbi:MAG: hypothetical protein IPG04_33770 [Polyangiaceae bacterium]|jgi:phosphohistidine swiveling domain-containing protein|nr:hypothetical protein [Polyangiaceae bacterium]
MTLSQLEPSSSGAPRPHVVDLFQSDDPRVVGGKAAPLARAARAGHNVPRGVVITTSGKRAGGEALQSALMDALAALGPGPYAVRSSAFGEDGAAQSFAGQLETHLGVSAADVPAAVRLCWESVEAARALRYSGAKLAEVAVIVQQMVPAELAGVAFSADPQTGERGVTVIEAVRGLGDKLVSGAADPEAWRVKGQACEVTRRGASSVLSDAQARRVAELARAMESLFGAPQDVEWALQGEELFLLQSRPITALPAAPRPISIEVPKGGWDRDDHHGVLSPLGWAWFAAYPKAMAAAFKRIGMPIEDMRVARVGGHLYMQMVMGGGDSPRLPPRWVLWLAARLMPSLRRANREGARFLDEELFMHAVDRYEREWKAELRADIARLFEDDPTGLSDDALLDRIDACLALTSKGLGYHAEIGGAFFAAGKLLLFVEDHLGWDASTLYSLMAGSSPATTELHDQIEALVREHAEEFEAQAELPRSWPALSIACPRFASALAAWLADNRLRMLHYDPKNAMLGERPDYVLSIAEGVAHDLGVREAAPARNDGQRESLLTEARSRLSPELYVELERLVGVARRAYASRDANGVETVSRPAGLLRHFVLELGRRLEPVIGDRRHAVYLYPDEHRRALRRELDDLSGLIERRRGEETWALANRGPKRYGSPKPPSPPADVFQSGFARMMRIFGWMEACEATPEASADGALRGVGVGHRVVTGRARVVGDPTELVKLKHGEILVCRITSPEWAVGLGRVAAIVTNEGGQLSHPAIIAREFGISAVLGAAEATARIKSGDRLRVDPAAGEVTILP